MSVVSLFYVQHLPFKIYKVSIKMLEILPIYKRVERRLYTICVVQFCGYSLPPMFHNIHKYTGLQTFNNLVSANCRYCLKLVQPGPNAAARSKLSVSGKRPDNGFCGFCARTGLHAAVLCYSVLCSLTEAPLFRITALKGDEKTYYKNYVYSVLYQTVK